MFSKCKFLLTYVTSMCIYGFYRGYHGLYYEEKKERELMVEKMIDGIMGSLNQLNPLAQPYLLYGIARRTEKKLRNLEITKNDYKELV